MAGVAYPDFGHMVASSPQGHIERQTTTHTHVHADGQLRMTSSSDMASVLVEGGSQREQRETSQTQAPIINQIFFMEECDTHNK